MRIFTQEVALGYVILSFTFALPFGQRFSIPLRAGDRWFRACCFWSFWALCAHRTGNKCPTLVQSMPNACSVDARRLFTECPLDGQDKPSDGLLQNGLCDFIPNPACQSFFLFIVCIGILYIQEELVLKLFIKQE